MTFNTETTAEGHSWVLFSEVLSLAMIGDAKTANDKCRIQPEIPVLPLPHHDQRAKYIKKEDIPRLFSRYARLNSEQSQAVALILQSIAPDNAPGDSPDNVSDTPDNYPGKRRPDKNKTGGKPAINFQDRWWNTWGNSLGDVYRSPLVAYLAFTAMVVSLAILHTTGAWRILPGLPWWDMPVLSFLMQSIILVGTFNAHHFFQKAGAYYLFLGVFALYDLVMSACNFFYGYDPTKLSGNGQQLVVAIIDLALRAGLSIGFPVGTLFFALLVKRIRAN